VGLLPVRSCHTFETLLRDIRMFSSYVCVLLGADIANGAKRVPRVHLTVDC
jgi:hypothetical protein